MKAAVLGRPFQIRWGGSTDLIYTEDGARAFLAAAGARLDGARVYNLHGASAVVADVVRMIEAARPSRQGLDHPRGAAHPVSGGARRRALPEGSRSRPPTSLADGGAKTLDEFERLKKDERLDSRELT
jgi:nucleoside-diphosphate-sugar epimerase